MKREEAIDCLTGIKIYLHTEHIDEEAIDVAIEALSATREWIPVSERLPKTNNGRYLVFYWLMENMPWISIMYYGKPTFPEKDHPCFYASDDEYGDVEYDEVVAWMPLPEPYEGECDTCKHKGEPWDSEACDGCCGNHSNYERR